MTTRETDERIVVPATFADFKLIKTRGQAQLILEVPIEHADRALRALGGVPAGDERWVGIVRVTAEAARRALGQAVEPKENKEETEADRAIKAAHAMAGDDRFQNWLRTRKGFRMPVGGAFDTAIQYIRQRCGVASTTEFRTKPRALSSFYALQDEYLQDTGQRTWRAA